MISGKKTIGIVQCRVSLLEDKGMPKLFETKLAVGFKQPERIVVMRVYTLW
jgi:hypothetical protein